MGTTEEKKPRYDEAMVMVRVNRSDWRPVPQRLIDSRIMSDLVRNGIIDSFDVRLADQSDLDGFEQRMFDAGILVVRP